MAVNQFNSLLILTASAALLGLEVNEAIAKASNISASRPDSQLHRVQVAKKTERNFKTSKGTLKAGSVLSVDPDQVRGIPKADARRRFILNKIYRVQEGTSADDLFIVDEKANKWGVENVSDATMGPTTHSLAEIVSGKGKVWALIQKF